LRIELKPELTEPFRERCYDCYRPRASCFCHAIPDIDNSTRVIIVQHQRERSHAFNTARIVKKSLRRCQLFSHRFEIEQLAEVAALPNTGLLFPGADAQPLPVAGHSQSLKQLVLIDGTWHHAKTMLRDIPVLRDLPCYQLAPESPGRYRIRREPNQFSLSTLEATVQALSVLEPETAGLGQLLNAFESMVEGQLAHPQERSLRRNLRRSLTPLNIPVALVRRIDDIVVAYGEATPRDASLKRLTQKPVYWVAERLSTGEKFRSTIATAEPLADSFLRHFQLGRDDFESSPTEDDFRAAWNNFLRPNELLVVYHPSTERMLANIGANSLPCIALKSIDYAPFHGAGALEQLIEAAEIHVGPSAHPGRAGDRLAMAKALVLRFHQLASDWIAARCDV
jgi:DTW domain-containing protein